MRKANIVCAVIGMIFSATAFIMTLSFKQFKNVPVGPEFFPRYIAIFLFICCAVLLIQSLMTPLNKDTPGPALDKKGILRLLLGIVIILVYILCWDFLGFIIMTPIVMFIIMMLLGLRRYPTMILFSFGAMAVIFCTFRYILGIDMPMGLLDGLF